jgi:hypothetical protein
MKHIHQFSLLVGFILGVLGTSLIPYVSTSMAQAKTEGMTQDEVDKKLDEVIEAQKKIKQRLEAITTQTQFLKASSGK